MGKDTGIAWTHHTFNPWWGCTKVSPGCDNCYAEAFDKRVGGHHWGKDAPRRLFTQKHWDEPKKWNMLASKACERHRVFCASMADWTDVDAPAGELARLWDLIRATPHLDWLLLTKRAARIRLCLPEDWGNGYPNVWLGVTVDDQRNGLPRVDVLRDIPARVRFLSVEPLLEYLGTVNLSGIHWAIVGGESGHHSRPFHLDWARSLVRQCREQGTRPFVKQMGAVPLVGANDHGVGRLVRNAEGAERIAFKFKDRKGEDMAEWPEDLRVREFPEAP